jgi:hypothetical protein
LRAVIASVTALLSAHTALAAEPTKVQTYPPCEAVNEAAYDAFEPSLKRRQPRIDAFGFKGEVRGEEDGRIFIQLQFGNAVAWFDGQAKAKLTRTETGETTFLISKTGDAKSNSLRLVLWDGNIECGWPPELVK